MSCSRTQQASFPAQMTKMKLSYAMKNQAALFVKKIKLLGVAVTRLHRKFRNQ